MNVHLIQWEIQKCNKIEGVLFKIMKLMYSSGIIGSWGKQTMLNRKFVLENLEIQTFRSQTFLVSINF